MNLRNVPARGKRGFSLIELLVVAVLGVFVVIATYKVLVVNQRTYTANTATIQSQQTVRAGLAVLYGELRELSTEGGDVLAFASDSMKVRVMRRFGLVCNVGALGVYVDAMRVGEWFEVGDSVVVFADTDPNVTSDDVWVTGRISGRDTTHACGGEPAQRLTIPDVATSWSGGNLVAMGAPVRSYVHYTYGLFTVDGEPFLARRESGGTVVPLVGPLRATNGLRFVYYDTLGAVATTAADIAQVQVTLRTRSSVLGPDGEYIADSITTRIYARN